MLKERGYTVLKREDGTEVELLFRTWTFKRFCELNGDITYQQMIEVLTAGIGIKHMAQLLLCASEYYHIKNKKPFAYTDFDACEWIDELGGLNAAAFVDVIGVMTAALVDTGAPVKEEKKKAASK